MGVKSMMPISGQTCHNIIKMHICLVSFKMEITFRNLFLCRGNHEMFKMMV